VIDEVAMQLALRSKALTLSVATTGAVSLSATSTGYARTSGSFITDGFYPGMEIVATGFGNAANNARSVVTYVQALSITALPYVLSVDGQGNQVVTRPPTATEAASAGRTLVAGLPFMRAWENQAFQPIAGIPWVREEFLPGPTSQETMGPFGELEATPMYALYVNVAAETGLTGKRYVNALRVLFAPRTIITLANGDHLRVRADTGPYAAQLQQSTPGFATQPLTIPLRLRTPNAI
jgi:hypothetical protein